MLLARRVTKSGLGGSCGRGRGIGVLGAVGSVGEDIGDGG